jgi:hypothetical protein
MREAVVSSGQSSHLNCELVDLVCFIRQND